MVEEVLIREFVEKIENAASFIKNVNTDNIKELSIDDLDTNTTEFAHTLIRQFNIPLYYCPHTNYAIQELQKLVAAKNVDEFIDSLEEYAEAMEEWAKAEEEVVIDLLDDYELDYIREITELTDIKTLYSNYWNIWSCGQYVERARIEIYYEKRKLFTREFELHIAEIYLPKNCFFIEKINGNIDCIIKEIEEFFEEYENSELTTYELCDKLLSVFN